MGALSDAGGLFSRAGADLAANLRFFTRLPAPGREFQPPDFARIAWAAPLAGAIVGAIGGLALVIGHGLRLPSFICAPLALTAMIGATGALHEDGLADVADGFGGGRTRDEKLQILRDSRLGAYGAVALTLMLLIRSAAIAGLLHAGVGFAVAGLMFAGAAARAGALAPLALMKPARADGAGAAGARGLELHHLGEAVACVVILAFALGVLGLGVMRAWFALIVAAAAVYGLIALARRQIGGQTGDVAGAAAAVAEAAAQVALLIGGPGA